MSEIVSHPNSARYGSISYGGADSESKGRGCFFYGCLGFFLICMVACGAIVWGLRNQVDKLVEAHTNESPSLSAPAEISASEVAGYMFRMEESSG